MRAREDIPELLDEDLGTPQEIETSLRDLRRINRWFGGVNASRHLMSRVLATTGLCSLSVLEVGGANGDVPFSVQQSFPSDALRYTILDRNPSHLNGRFPSLAADALELPFRDATFDVVSSSLLLHHFNPDEVVLFVRDALRVARDAVIINDLRRHPLHLALVYAGMPLYRSRITRHDSVASVRRAYTSTELVELLTTNFPNRIELTTHFLYRMGVIVWK